MPKPDGNGSLCKRCGITRGAALAGETLPSNSLPPNMAATNLSFDRPSAADNIVRKECLD